MRRDEVGLLLFAALVGCAAGVAVAAAGSYLAGALWFNVGANTIQWMSGPSTFAVVVMALWMRWHKRCAVPYCVRVGEHPVDGTLKKVCVAHHTLAHHELCHDLFSEAHRIADRLGWGESHRRAAADAEEALVERGTIRFGGPAPPRREPR